MIDPNRDHRLAEIAGLAVKLESSTEVPALSTVAQWAVESKWGAAPAGEHNCFGIKRASRHTLYCLKTTREWYCQAQIDHWNHEHPDRKARPTGKVSPSGKLDVMLDDEFADYRSLEESVADYCWLISHGSPYAAAWKEYLVNRNIPQLVAGVANAYSTTEDYQNLVNAIAGQSNVRNAIAAARS